MRQNRFEEFSSLISGIHGDIQKLKARYTGPLQLKSVHIFWLYLLREHPEGLSASELAASAKSSRSLVSREIEELVERGIIVTQQKADKRRYGWKFVLTEKGEELATQIWNISKAIQDTVSRDIPAEDLVVFYRTLNTLSENFEELVKSERSIT